MFPIFKRKRLSNTARAKLHAAVLLAQQELGLATNWPLCNICGMVIGPGRDWHDSHMPAPHAITGAPADGIAHVRCNLERARSHDAALIAKTARQKMRAIGAKTPRNALPFGRNDPRKRTLSGRIVMPRRANPRKRNRDETAAPPQARSVHPDRAAPDRT